MASPTKPFHVGDTCGGAKIISIHIAHLHQDTRYIIRCGYCGATVCISHRAARARVNKTRKTGRNPKCSKCKGNGRKPSHKNTKKSGQIWVPGWGLTLGKFNRHDPGSKW